MQTSEMAFPACVWYSSLPNIKAVGTITCKLKQCDFTPVDVETCKNKSVFAYKYSMFLVYIYPKKMDYGTKVFSWLNLTVNVYCLHNGKLGNFQRKIAQQRKIKMCQQFDLSLGSLLYKVFWYHILACVYWNIKIAQCQHNTYTQFSLGIF